MAAAPPVTTPKFTPPAEPAASRPAPAVRRPTPLDRAAESLAPAPPTTSFFAPNPNDGAVLARYAANRDSFQVGSAALQEANRITGSRWDRVARRRQRELWGREDEEYAAKKGFDVKRGEFLSSVALIDPEADDYEEQRNRLIADMPEEAMRDDAVRSIFAAKDRIYGDRLMQRRQEQADERRMQAYRAKDLDAARKAFVAEGGDPAAAATTDDPFVLYGWSGELKRLNAEDKMLFNDELIRGRDSARRGGKDASAERARQREALVAAVQDTGRFPGLTDAEGGELTGEERLTAALNQAIAVPKRDKYIAAGPEGQSGYSKQVRGLVWDEAQRMKETLGIAGGETPAAPAPEPAGVLDLPKPPKPGVPIDEDTALRYVEASGGNVMEAMQRAEAAGWAIPKKK